MNDIVVRVGDFAINGSQPWRGGLWSARLFAGLQAGVTAGVMTTCWFVFENWRTGRAPWVAINLISTAVLGRSGYVYGFGIATLIGLSLHLVVSGLYGLLFAVVVSPRIRPFMAANAGLVFSFSGFAFTFIWILPRFAPILYRNAPRLEWAGAHFLAGMVLGLYPDIARGLVTQEDVAPSTPEALGTAISDVHP